MIYILSKEFPHVFGNLLNDLNNLDKSKRWKIEVKEHKKARTNSQNALYWKWLEIMGDHFGYTKDEMHEELASRFLGMVERTTIGGRNIIEPFSTTKLSTKGFTDYMDKIQMLAVNQGITLPQPDYYGVENER